MFLLPFHRKKIWWGSIIYGWPSFVANNMRFVFLYYYKNVDREIYLAKGLEIAYMFLPWKSPILLQIVSTQKISYGIEKQVIPENEDCQYTLKILK